ncbi:MAG: hypothetical protein WAT22_08350 [Saprospiraceae bacterium]|nr:hypothetical protein [Saprospiraceae bacterium]
MFTGQVYYPKINLKTPPFLMTVTSHFIKKQNLSTRNQITPIPIYRNQYFSDAEQKTYETIDSVLSHSKLPKMLNIAGLIMEGKWPTKIFDINLGKVLAFNLYEKTRLGLGISTNDSLLKKISISGFWGYGFGDKSAKFGGHINTKVNNNIAITAKYEKTIREAGSFNNLKTSSLFDNRSFISSRFDEIKFYELEVRSSQNGITWQASTKHEILNPLYEYTYGNGNSQQIFTNSQLTVGFQYQHNQSSLLLLNRRINSNRGFPTISVSVSKGFKGFLNGEFDFVKLHFDLSQSFYLQNVGTTAYNVQAGWINGALPYGLLFEGRGSFHKDIPFVMKNFFQTMRPYEFMHDRFTCLFTRHTFNHWFANSTFSPLVTLHFNSGIGSLKKKEVHQNIPIQVMEIPYFETGLELNRLLKINYLNLGYVGFGFGVFSRLGYHSYDSIHENLFLKITANFYSR